MTTSKSLVERIGDAVEGWEPAILLAAILGFILLGFAFRGFGDIEALAVGFLLPVGALFAGGLGLRGQSKAIVVLGLLLCLAAFFASEEQVSEVLFPWSPIDRGSLRVGESIELDSAAPEALRVAVHGDLKGTSAEARYELELQRGDKSISVRGHIKRETYRTRKGTRTSVHLTERHDILLEASGPIRVTLTRADDMLKAPMLIEIRGAPTQGVLARWALLGCLIGAAILEAASTRRGKRLHLAPAVGIVMAFSEFVAKYYNADSPLKFMVGAMLFSFIAGGLGGWVAGAISTSLFGKRPARPGGSSSSDEVLEPIEDYDDDDEYDDE